MDWLVEFDQTDEARALARITADVELLTELALNGFAGRSYVRFADILAKYGIAVISSWCRKGRIYAKCAEKGYGIAYQLPIPPDEAFELALETVARALRSYRDTVLLRGRWDPTRGATVKTYFIGHCLLTFPNVYKHWQRQERRRPPIDPAAGEALLRARDSGRSPEHRVLDLETLVEGLAPIDPDLRRILFYKAQGHPNEQIAVLCGLTVPAVKSRLHRFTNWKDRGVA